MSLARSGHLWRPREAGPYRRSDGACQQPKLVHERAERRSASRKVEEAMFTPCQPKDTPHAGSRALPANHSRAVSRALNAYDCCAVGWALNAYNSVMPTSR